MSWSLLQNSLAVSALATALALAMGLGAALFAAGLEPAGRGVVLGLGGVALALPPFLVTNCWLTLLGHTGVWRGWLPLDIYSLGGTVWILALLLWPLTLFAALAAWRKLDSTWLEIEPRLRGGALLRRLLLPAAWPAVAPAAVLTFVLALNNFAVPALLQVKVLPAAVWLEFSTSFDYTRALLTGLPLVLAPGVVLLVLRQRELVWPRAGGVFTPECFRRRLGLKWWGGAGVAGGALGGAAVLLPLGALVTSARSWAELPGAFAAGRSALAASVGFATVTATLVVLLGLATWRWRRGSALWLPFLVPGVVLGVALILLLNRPPFVALYQSVFVVVLALGIRYAGLGWQGIAMARRAADADLIDAARMAGARGGRLFWLALWPQMAAPLAATWYTVYLLVLWDVETLVLIVPPGGETLALRIFNLLHYGHNAQVNALGLLLLAVALAPLALWPLVRRVGGRA